MTDSIDVHKKHAENYDKIARDYEWHGHELIFGLCCEFLTSDSRLLDVGIGTGLSSELFVRTGVEITGMDGSEEMLEQCEKKKIAKELIQHDITKTPWPLDSELFDIVIAVGVFHFFEEVEPFFKEVGCVIRPNGIFAFPIVDPNEDRKQQRYTQPVKRIIEGTNVYAHPLEYIDALLDRTGFTKLKQVAFLAKSSPEKPDEMLYRAIVAQRKSE